MNHYEKAAKLAEKIEAHPDSLDRVDLPEVNYYADGVYVRTLRVPAGVAMVGKIHKRKHIFALIEGRIVINDKGEKHEIVAPSFFVVEAGAQRVIVALEDSMMMNAHGVENGMTLEEIEDYLTTDDHRELPATPERRLM